MSHCPLSISLVIALSVASLACAHRPPSGAAGATVASIPSVTTVPPVALAASVIPAPIPIEGPPRSSVSSAITWPGDETRTSETDTFTDEPWHLEPTAGQQLLRFLTTQARRGPRWSAWRFDASAPTRCSSLHFEHRPWTLRLRFGGPVVYGEPRLDLSKARIIYQGGFAFDRPSRTAPTSSTRVRSVLVPLVAVLILGSPMSEFFHRGRRAWVRGFTTRCGYLRLPVIAMTPDRIVLARVYAVDPTRWRPVTLFLSQGACETAARERVPAALVARRETIDCQERV